MERLENLLPSPELSKITRASNWLLRIPVYWIVIVLAFIFSAGLVIGWKLRFDESIDRLFLDMQSIERTIPMPWEAYKYD